MMEYKNHVESNLNFEFKNDAGRNDVYSSTHICLLGKNIMYTHSLYFFWLNSLTLILFNLNPFHANALFCYPYVKKPEVFYCFQGLWKFNIGLNWVN